MFSKKYLSVIFCCCAIGLFAQEVAVSEEGEPSVAAWKREKPAPQSAPAVKEPATSHLQFGGSYTHVRIRTHDTPDYNGNLAGVQGMYEFRTPNRIYGGALLRWREGKASSAANAMTFTDWNAQERIGYTVGNSSHLFSLFTGLGFRFIDHDLQDNPYGFSFLYEEFYVPVGFAYDCRVSSWFSWGLYATWMPQVYPSVTLKPMGGARWILQRTFKNGLVEMPFTFSSERFETVSFILKPFAEYWQDGEGRALALPSNAYLFVGADLNICFSF